MQVLVVCKRGANRSAALCTAILMAIGSVSVEAAIDYLRKLRCICWIETPAGEMRSQVSHLERLQAWQGTLWRAGGGRGLDLQDICVWSCQTQTK